jgi:hypothetical protein
MFPKIFIANRGEIACRIIRTARAARGPFKPARRLASANAVLSLMKGELPGAGELAYFMKNIAACGLCFPASPFRSASGKKGA